MTLGLGIMDCMLPCSWAICLDVGQKYAGIISGAMNTAGSLGGFLCALLFGWVVKATGNYNLPVLGIAAMGFTIAGAPAGMGKLDIPRLLGRLRAHRPDASVILEQWTPLGVSFEAAVAEQERWAVEGVRYLQQAMAASEKNLATTPEI